MKGKLYLGVAREVITPKVGGNLYGYNPDVISESVHDDLTLTAFYFTDGSASALMISATVCLMNTELCDSALSLIEERFGIPKGNCLLHCTHTHSGPNLVGNFGWGEIDREYYDGIFLPALLRAVERAMVSPVAVTVGVASGNSYAAVNRRELRSDNVVYLGQNPWGPFDPTMTVMAFKGEDGAPIANIIHYGMHGTCAGINKEITRDWSGIMIDEVEKQSGAITAFFNGAEGDVGPRLTNGHTVGDIGYVERLGGLAAQDACGIYRSIRSYEDAELSVLSDSVRIPLDGRVALDTALEEYEKYKKNTVNLQGKKAHYYKTQIELYRDGYVDKEFREVPQTVIRIGGVAFVGMPYELFSEIAMRIARERPFPYTLSLSNTNGSEGYFVTEDQICRGGYEIDMFKTGYHQPYADNADWHMVNETLKNLRRLAEINNEE